MKNDRNTIKHVRALQIYLLIKFFHFTIHANQEFSKIINIIDGKYFQLLNHL